LEGKHGELAVGWEFGGEHAVVEAGLGKVRFGGTSAEFELNHTPVAGGAIVKEDISFTQYEEVGLDLPAEGVVEADELIEALPEAVLVVNEMRSEGSAQNAHPPFAEVAASLPKVQNGLAVDGEGLALAGQKRGEELIVEMIAEELGSVRRGETGGVEPTAPESVTGRIGQSRDGFMKEGAKEGEAGCAGAFSETEVAQKRGAYFADSQNETAHTPGLKRRRRGRGWGTRRPGE
jgi:hypothetical protein